MYTTEHPKPGNFQPHFTDTQYFIDAVNDFTDNDYTWFFEHYLYQAKLPKLIEQRVGDSLRLRWETQADSKFEMPLDILIDGEKQQVLVSNFDDTVVTGLSADAHIIIDPNHKVLRDINYISKRAEFDRTRLAAQAEASE